MLASELYHHGILGQKWGVRRFQNADGSLTEEGKKRYGDNGIEVNVTTKTDITQKNLKNQESLEAKKQEILNSRSAEELYKNANLFTTSELQAAYTRLQLEKSIQSLSPKQISKGQQFVNSAINTTRQVADLTTNSINLYNNIAKVYNSLFDGDLKTIGNNNSNNKTKS